MGLMAKDCLELKSSNPKYSILFYCTVLWRIIPISSFSKPKEKRYNMLTEISTYWLKYGGVSNL